MNGVLSRMQQVLSEVLDLDDVILRDDMTLMDPQLPEWDSLANVDFMLGLEKEFSIEFSTDEINQVRSIADLRKRIESKIGG